MTSASSDLLLLGGLVVTPFRRIKPGGVYIVDGKIGGVGRAADFESLRTRPDLSILDCSDCIVAPGFIDIHVHGAGGGDVMNGTTASIRTMARYHAMGGTTALLPTTLTAPTPSIAKALDAIASVQQEEATDRAQVLGAHVEGPHIAVEQAGAQNPAHIRGATPRDIEFLTQRADSVRLVTAAPEIENGLTLGNALAHHGIVPSMGHSSAAYKEVSQALEAGYRSVTHLFCGMKPWINVRGDKRGGLVESAFLYDDLFVEMIADLNHVSAHLMQLTFKVKGADRVALITDGMWATGMPPGPYTMGGLDIIVTESAARLADDSGNAGSVATMETCVQNVVTHAGVPLADALRSAALTPAALIGADRQKGSLTPGKDGDVTVLDAHLRVRATVTSGRVVYQREDEQ